MQKREFEKRAREIVRKALVCHRNILYKDYNRVMRAEGHVLELANHLNDEAVAAGTLVGRLYQEGVADGYSVNVVVKANTRTMFFEHLPLGDAWQSRILGFCDYKMAVSKAHMLKSSSVGALFGESHFCKPMTAEEFAAWEKEVK